VIFVKKCMPVITHTEILARAAKSIEDEISGWEQKFEGFDGMEEMLSSTTKELHKKLDAVKTLYQIETGSSM
jgi:hypothetical protein